MRKLSLVCLVALVLSGSALADSAKPLLLQRPTISKSEVAFNYAGDLWIVAREGGEARRLTSGVGLEFNPIFSPDGSQIAFSAEYDGNIDVYVMPASGGEPRRLTYHPAVDTVVGWSPDGKNILFSSGRSSYSRFNKLFTIPATGGGLPTELPLPMGEQGAFTPDGTQLAYVPFWNRRQVPNAYIAWKRYRGGLASPIWIANLADSRITKVPREESNDTCPMWFEGKLYFLSDRAGPTTLFSYDPATKQVKKELENAGYDLISASVGPDVIVYEQFGSLHIFEPHKGAARPIQVRITADFPDVRPHYEKVAKKIRNGSLSPSGARVALEARGEIFTVPAEKGDIRNLTQTTGAAERDPAWSPDGKTIAYFSDESGEYMLHLHDAKGTGPAKRIALGDAPNIYFQPCWSPDSKKIAYRDARALLWLLDVDTGKSTRVDRHNVESAEFDTAWSPDSHWLVYTKSMPNRLRAVFLYDVAASKSHQVTDGMSDARFPVFDKNGKYLYFTASTDIGPTTNGIDMSGMLRPVTRSVYLVVLDKSLPSPFAPQSDEEKDKATDGAKDGDKKEDKKGDEKDKGKDKTAITKIDLDNIGQRILAVPLPNHNYSGLLVGKAGTLFLLHQPTLPTPPAPGQDGPEDDVTVQKFDLESRKAEPVIAGVADFQVAANGEKMAYRQQDKFYIRPVAGGPPGGGTAARGGDGPKPLNLDAMEVHVDPRAEWRQMYHEAWRLQRDYLYDPNYHGLDLAAAEKKYAVFLDGIAHRADLNYLFNEMLGQTTLGHTYVGGGDTPEVKKVRGGLLGADYVIDGGRYRFARVYSGENWNPQLRAPLTQPGVNVKEGEYLLAVNGKELHAPDNPYRLFEATAGKSVIIKVGPTGDGKNAREVTVVPIDNERGLRNLAWIEGNRRKVNELSGGKVAYIYLPNTAYEGYTNFNRYFFAQVDKQAAVVDERFNGGGLAADYIIDYLHRPLMNYWTTRQGKIYTTPGGAIFGPKAMIINEFAGSGGDAMPWYFRRAGVGKLVGKRTWGGLVGISGFPPLLDGGGVTAPDFAFFTPEGTWEVENHGVPPDVEVDLDPYEVRTGHDPQLEKAVAVVLEELKKNPPPQPKIPAYPNYHQKKNGG